MPVDRLSTESRGDSAAVQRGVCPASSAPLAELHDSNSGSAVVLVPNVKQRYLSILAGDPGRMQAIRVTFVSLPPPWDIWNGSTFWVSTVREVCNLPSIVSPLECPSGAGTIQVAELTCSPTDALIRDWSACGVIHIFHPGIVPSNRVVTAVDAVYHVQVVDGFCDLLDGGSYSPALVLINPMFGDSTGSFDADGVYYTTPDGFVGLAPDVVSIASAFAYAPGSPAKTRVDIAPCRSDERITATDIVRAVDAFANLRFPYAPGIFNSLECPSTDPCYYTSGPGAPAAGCAPTSVCGNGAIEAPEQCDDGPANADGNPDACRTDCRLPRCGDGIVDSGEQCDPPFSNGPNFCDESCQLVAGAVLPVPVRLVPVSASTPHTINGADIHVQPGARVVLEVRVGDFDPLDVGVQVKAVQATIDAGGLTSGFFGALAPAQQICDDAADCSPSVAPGSTCDLTPVCGSECDCRPTFVDTERGDIAFTFGLAAVDMSAPDHRMSVARLVSFSGGDDPVPFPPEGLYAGTVALDASPDAFGTFTIGLRPGAVHTTLLDQNRADMPLDLVAARIIIEAVACCYSDQTCTLMANPGTCVDGGGEPAAGNCGDDLDGDGTADPCDDDLDGDGVLNSADNCPRIANTGQPDTDSDGVGDECDNCALANPNQADCQGNGVGDVCDIAAATSADCNSDSTPDECVPPAGTPGAPSTPIANRYIGFNGPSTRNHAIRVTLVDLPAPYDAFEGRVLWVSAPVLVSQGAGSANPAAGYPTFNASSLQCAPLFGSWLEEVHIQSPLIIPGGRYRLQAVDSTCDMQSEANFSAPREVINPRWGDVVGEFRTETGSWTPPNGNVSITDAVSILDKFANRAGAPGKPSADLEPATVDFRINITDVARALDGFRNIPYPFAPPAWPCP